MRQVIGKCHDCKAEIVIEISRETYTMVWDCPRCRQSSFIWPDMERDFPKSIHGGLTPEARAPRDLSPAASLEECVPVLARPYP